MSWSPTPEFMSTPFYTNTQTYSNKLQYAYDNANNASCDTVELNNLKTAIQNLKNCFDNTMLQYIDAVRGLYELLTSTDGCIYNSLGVSNTSDFHSSISNSIDNILSSNAFSSIYATIDDIVNAIDNGETCDNVITLVTNAQGQCDNFNAKVVTMLNTLDEYKQFVYDIGQGIAKLSSIMSCVQTTLSQVAGYVGVFNPDYANAINEALSTSGNIGQKIQAGLNKLRQDLDVENKLNTFASNLSI